MTEQVFPGLTLKAGWALWAAHESKYDATSFNPNNTVLPSDLNNGGRFHPFLDKQRRPVATRYASVHPAGAFAETLLRRDNGDPHPDILRINSYVLTLFSLNRDLEFTDLADESMPPEIQQWLLEGREAYLYLRDLAGSLHALFPKRHGIRWTSKQIGIEGFDSFVLFGDRCQQDDMVVLEQYPLTTGEGLRYLRGAAKLQSGVLPQSLLPSN